MVDLTERLKVEAFAWQLIKISRIPFIIFLFLRLELIQGDNE